MLKRMKTTWAVAMMTAALAVAARPALGQAVVAHADFPAVTPSSATLRASLTASAQVWLCWGNGSGGSNFAAWENNLPLGNRPAGLLTQTLSSLNTFQNYHFVWRAVSGTNESWTTIATFRPQQPGMIYRTGFESSELFPFTAGNLDQQGGAAGWRVYSGTGTVAPGGHTGTQAVQAAGGSLGLNLSSAAPVVWVDGFVLDAGSTNPPMLPTNLANAVLFFSAANGLLALDGDGAGSGFFVQVQASLPTNRFLRLTLRLDYAARRYDVWVDGLPQRTGLGFKDAGSTSFSAFTRQTESASVLDDFSISTWGLDADSDGDGLNDLDEAKFHGSYPLLADSDGDGVGDMQEVIAGTDPGDPTDFFALTIGPDNQGVARVSFPTITGRQYTLYHAAGLGGAWNGVPELSAVPGDGTPRSYLETNAIPAAFYRAEVALPGGIPQP